MSKALLSGESITAKPFSDMLPIVPRGHKRLEGHQRLGRTATALETLRTQAQADGYAQGLAEGLLDGQSTGVEEGLRQDEAARQEALAQFREDLEGVGRLVQEAVQQWFVQAEESLAALGMEIGARLVARELTASPETALAIAQEAVAEVTHAGKARIRVNPFSSSVLAKHKDALMALSPSLKEVQITDDPSLLGGCMIESAGGCIDSSLETRVLSILAELRDHYAAATIERSSGTGLVAVDGGDQAEAA